MRSISALATVLLLSCSRNAPRDRQSVERPVASESPRSTVRLPLPSSVTMPTPKQDCEDLLSALLPVAKQMLTRYREFYPLGGTISPSGEIAHVSGWTGDERPPSADLIALLNDVFRRGATAAKYRATALVFDVRVVPPGATAKQDAIAVNLDHQDGYSVVVMFPYTFSSAGELLVSAPFASAGTKSIFVQ